MSHLAYYIGGGAALFGVITVLFSVAFRTVVPTNQVHIVQTGRKTTSYGRGQPAGNVYWRIPSWIPMFGVKVTDLPVSVFELSLKDYAAYDVDRLPFQLDIVSFFRIADSNMAAERVKNFDDLQHQMTPILQGASRTILAAATIDQILGQRAMFGQKFTEEVTHQLVQWGVEPVKNIEIMDVRDSQGSSVIANIMAKKKSEIEKESRVAVANNMQAAQTAEIEAKRTVGLATQDAEQQVGERTAQKDQKVGIATQKAKQAIALEAKTTTAAEMDVRQVEQVRQAEITKEVQVVAAEQDKATRIVRADGEKQTLTLEADGKLAATTREATGIELKGAATAKAQELLLLAPVNSQITLAKEIGNNDSYQGYLIRLREIEANQQVGISVGVEQAKALQKAEIKIVSTAGDPGAGLNGIRDLFTIGGAQKLGAIAETLSNNDLGKAARAIITGAPAPAAVDHDDKAAA